MKTFIATLILSSSLLIAATTQANEKQEETTTISNSIAVSVIELRDDLKASALDYIAEQKSSVQHSIRVIAPAMIASTMKK